MKTLFLTCLFALWLRPGLRAEDFSAYQPIGAATAVHPDERGVTIDCADGSQVRLSFLGPGIVRVRAAYRAGLPAHDHSWAIARTDWPAVRFAVAEEPAGIAVTTDGLRVWVARNPLLVEFQDPATHRAINADYQPMAFEPKEGRVAAFKRLNLDEHFYGLGEKAAHLDKRRDVFSMWNSDTPFYKLGTDPIYQDIPFYIGWQGPTAYGLFYDNSYRSHFDFGHEEMRYASYFSEGGELNYYFLAGPSLARILGHYADLTGHMPLPPKWALGNQQSRYSYYEAPVAEAIVSRYRADDLPLDVLHLDIDYMDAYRVFTFNTARFPHPAEITARLRQQGVKVVTIVDPGVKYQPPAGAPAAETPHPELGGHADNYYVYNQGLAHDYFLRRKGGGLYIGRVWPGDAVFVDYTIEAAARWWGDLHRAYLDNGVAGIWNDMNEPSDFVDKSGDTQADVISYDDGAHSPYAKNRNVFALGMARATYEGLQRLRPNDRPYVITRAGYAGIQRYSTMWTGDVESTWDALALSLPVFQSLGLSGEPFVGADLPGFGGRATGELMARWYEAAFLAPFCRNHADRQAYDHEPWRFGPAYEDIVRKYLKLRYRLLPFLYTTLEEAHRTGLPVYRPLILNYQTDENTLDLEDEYMIGSDLLAAPIVREGATARRVYLPAGTWYDFWTSAVQPGGRMIPVNVPLEATPLYVRGGSILPTTVAMNYVGELPHAPVILQVYPDAAGRADGELYEDDGVSPGYEAGQFRRTKLSYRGGAAGAELTIRHEGGYRPPEHRLDLALPAGQEVTTVSLDGHPLERAAGEGSGWSRQGALLTVRLPDDGNEHRLTVH